MVKKIGVDIIQNQRIAKHLHDIKFIERVLSLQEIACYKQLTNIARQIEYLAGRFAAKEALYKALSPMCDFTFSAVSVLNASDGTPYISSSIINDTVLVTISHERDYTVAFVIVQ